MSLDDSTEHPEQFREWHHASPHSFVPNTSYMITASTLGKARLFDTPGKLDCLRSIIFDECSVYGWELEAWAIFSNHYHLICRAPGDAKTLERMIRKIHATSAVWFNRADGVKGRQVWFQYRDTCLTYETSYLARLHYVHANAVKHGLAKVPEGYPWCSMGWFLRRAPEGFRKTVLSFKMDSLAVDDDF